jgi:hypothetical protein
VAVLEGGVAGCGAGCAAVPAGRRKASSPPATTAIGTARRSGPDRKSAGVIGIDLLR